jgi:hypothetical protein
MIIILDLDSVMTETDPVSETLCLEKLMSMDYVQHNTMAAEKSVQPYTLFDADQTLLDEHGKAQFHEI